VQKLMTGKFQDVAPPNTLTKAIPLAVGVEGGVPCLTGQWRCRPRMGECWS
jgi:hypothetical protein